VVVSQAALLAKVFSEFGSSSFLSALVSRISCHHVLYSSAAGLERPWS
jgi:hypothetical protein